MLRGDPSGEEDRQREPPGHVTGEVKKKKKGSNLFDTFSLSLSFSHTHTHSHSLCDAASFSMEAVRRRQVRCFLDTSALRGLRRDASSRPPNPFFRRLEKSCRQVGFELSPSSRRDGSSVSTLRVSILPPPLRTSG